MTLNLAHRRCRIQGIQFEMHEVNTEPLDYRANVACKFDFNGMKRFVLKHRFTCQFSGSFLGSRLYMAKLCVT
jgi:hypothetical protein